MPLKEYSIRQGLKQARRFLSLLCVAALMGGCSLLTSPYPGPRSSGGAPPQSPYPAPAPAPKPVTPEPGPAVSKPMEPPPAPPAQPAPSSQASLDITEQGRRLLLGDQVEEAISVLERAIGMNPDNGQAYYWLAEAWLKKGNPKQALEYHHQAWLRLRNQPAWTARLHDQRERLQRGPG
jgi:tetratricopeptide (TPR) repeat protein